MFSMDHKGTHLWISMLFSITISNGLVCLITLFGCLLLTQMLKSNVFLWCECWWIKIFPSIKAKARAFTPFYSWYKRLVLTWLCSCVTLPCMKFRFDRIIKDPSLIDDLVLKHLFQCYNHIILKCRLYSNKFALQSGDLEIFEVTTI